MGRDGQGNYSLVWFKIIIRMHNTERCHLASNDHCRIYGVWTPTIAPYL